MKKILTLILLLFTVNGFSQVAEIIGTKSVMGNDLNIVIIGEDGKETKTKHETMVAAMNEMAKSGWELFSATVVPAGTKVENHWVLKKKE